MHTHSQAAALSLPVIFGGFIAEAAKVDIWVKLTTVSVVLTPLLHPRLQKHSVRVHHLPTYEHSAYNDFYGVGFQFSNRAT